MKLLFSHLQRELAAGEDCMLVTIISDKGSAPRGTGATMLVNRKGRVTGTVGGGSVEFAAEQRSLELLRDKRSELKYCRLHPNAKEDLGMLCGGEVELCLQYIGGGDAAAQALAERALTFLSRGIDAWLILTLSGDLPRMGVYAASGEGLGHLPDDEILKQLTAAPEGGCLLGGERYYTQKLGGKEHVIIFGGGHISQELAPLLNRLDFHVTIFENRAEYATAALFPLADELIIGDYSSISENVSIGSSDFLVVVTNGHAHDYTVEEQVIRGEHAYLGVIGSRAKTAAINKRLREAGVSDELIASVHTPIGLSIKAETPAEIAVSIAAELIMVRAERRGDGIFAGCPMHL